MPLYYEDYAKDISPDKLKQELDEMHGGVERHLMAISKELDGMDDMAAELGLHHRVLRDATEKHRHDPNKQRWVHHT